MREVGYTARRNLRVFLRGFRSPIDDTLGVYRLAYRMLNENSPVANRIKSDGPTKRIVAELRKVGATVEYFKAKRGKGNAGRPDLLVGFLGKNYLLEVKAPRGTLSEEQILYHSNWQGRKIDVVSTELEALIAIGLVP